MGHWLIQFSMYVRGAMQSRKRQLAPQCGMELRLKRFDSVARPHEPTQLHHDEPDSFPLLQYQ
jgi:hypothetical protein